MLVRILSAAAVAVTFSLATAGGAQAKSAEAEALKVCKKEIGWKKLGKKGRGGSRATYLLDECVRGKLGR